MFIKPFAAIRPNEIAADQVAALPYDVYDREGACAAVQGKPLSFLNIDRPETQFAPDADMYGSEVYAKARELLDARIADGTFVKEPTPCFYLYEPEMAGRAQTGLVACCAIDDYLNNTIKKHENTLEAKELDRIRHIDALDAQTGPIFLAYRDEAQVNALVAKIQTNTPLYSFMSEDGIAHRVWRISGEQEIDALAQAFEAVPAAYVADGHHRTASAVKVGLARRAQAQEAKTFTGNEEFNYFLSVLFPESQLRILPYNRVVHDLQGLTEEAFLQQLSSVYKVSAAQSEPFEPQEKGAVALYMRGAWYKLQVRPECTSEDPVEGLDVTVLQQRVLAPLLGIDDPRTNSRVEFVGGIYGLDELVKRVQKADAAASAAGTFAQNGPAVAFAMYPTSIEELLSVADAGLLMPPKSTWFEPKLRSGLFIHQL